MGLYNNVIGPRLVRCLCSMPDVEAERSAIVPLAYGVVLEIGIGPGLNLPFYDPSRVERVIGVDPNEGFLRLRGARESPVPVSILKAPAEAIPLPDASADTAVVTYTLCSVDDPSKTLREVKRVLKPDGLLLFVEHGRSDDADVARWQDWLNPLWRRFAVGCNLNRPVLGLLQQAGFAVGELDQHYIPAAPRPVGFTSRGTARPICAQVSGTGAQAPAAA